MDDVKTLYRDMNDQVVSFHANFIKYQDMTKNRDININNYN